MNKKYLILKKQAQTDNPALSYERELIVSNDHPIKASGGSNLWGTNQTLNEQLNQKTLIQNGINSGTLSSDGGKSGANTAISTNASTDKIGESNNNSTSNGSANSYIAGGMQAAAGLGSLAANSMTAGSGSKKDSFGNTVFGDKEAKDLKNQSAMSGMSKAMSIAAPLAMIPGVGTLGAIGIMAGSALLGGLFGNKKGKKEAGAAKEAYEKQKQNSTIATAKNADVKASQALLGKNGIKLEKRDLGNFRLQKKKPLH